MTKPLDPNRPHRSAKEVIAEARRNDEYKARLADAVVRKSISDVLAIAREFSPLVTGHGEHTLWGAYYDAVRLLDNWSGRGYENRAITARADTAAASNGHVPVYD